MKKKRFVILEYSAFNISDPFTNRDFLAKREEAFNDAILRAKFNIIKEMQSTNMQNQSIFVQKQFQGSFTLSAQMSLIGATVIQHAESWDPNNQVYEVAVLVFWSATLETEAKAILAGETTQPKSAYYLSKEWLESQDFGTVLGPRQFLDNQGNRHFIGIAVTPVWRKNSLLDMRSRESADLAAREVVNYSIFCKIKGEESIRQSIIVNEDDADRNVIETYDSSISYVNVPINISDLHPLLRKIVKHSITGQEMHIAVWGVSTKSAINNSSIQ